MKAIRKFEVYFRSRTGIYESPYSNKVHTEAVFFKKNLQGFKKKSTFENNTEKIYGFLCLCLIYIYSYSSVPIYKQYHKATSRRVKFICELFSSINLQNQSYLLKQLVSFFLLGEVLQATHRSVSEMKDETNYSYKHARINKYTITHYIQTTFNSEQ